MPTSKALKSRIRATKNISQMTKAMEAVSAVKMRKSQTVAISARPYALTALSILHEISGKIDNSENHFPLLTKNETDLHTVAIITSDKGLAGSFNSQVLREAEKFISKLDGKIEIVAIGKKARDYFKNRRSVSKEFLGNGNFGTLDETKHISKYLLENFLEKKPESTTLIYMNFVSAMRQEVTVRTLLPITTEDLEKIISSITPLHGRYANIPKTILEIGRNQEESLLIEPNPKELLGKLLPELLEIEVMHAILEANASEHSARMIAMKNASDNAKELVSDLTVLYNKARQASITKELSEITAGKEALQ